MKKTKKANKIIWISMIIILCVIICYSIKTYIYYARVKEVNREIKQRWFGYESTQLSASASNSDEINPIYIEPMKRWEKVGLIKILEETGVWTQAACEFVDVYEAGTMEYNILHGGFSFDDINYKDFASAMIEIDSRLHKSTCDTRDMLDFWQEAALIESENTYE